jgi:hypothetical protein
MMRRSVRQDTESLNAQLERAFYGERLLAWGVHNQTTVVLPAAVAENAWARHVWYNEANHQAQRQKLASHHARAHNSPTSAMRHAI